MSRKQAKVQKPIPPAPTKDQKKSIPIPISPMRVFAAEAANAELALAKTVDGFDNFVSRLGLQNNNTLSAGTYEFNLVTRNRIKLEAAYRGSWIVGKIIDVVAEDMTRAGIDITTNDSKKDLKEITSAISRLQVWGSLNDLKKWGALYGGALGVIQIEGQDLSTPLKLDTVAKDQFRGVVVYDRWQLNPVLTDVIDSGPEMGLPVFYQLVNNLTQSSPTAATAIGMEVVHHSRVIRNIGIKLPFFQAITEMMWGESVLERLWDRLISFDNATMSSAQLIDRANLRMVGIEGLREILAAGGAAQQGLLAQFEMMRQLQVNEGLTLLDKNDEYQSTAYSFAGLSDMLLQFGQQLSGAADIPLVRLFCQSPAGLNATGDSDLRMYYDKINAKQEAEFRNGFEILLKVLWRSVYGEAAPKDLSFTFNPLWQMTAKDKSDIAKSNTESIIEANEAGLIDRATGMKELRDTAGETGLFNNISDEAIQEAEDEDPPLSEIVAEPEPAVAAPGAKPPGAKPESKKPAVKDSKMELEIDREKLIAMFPEIHTKPMSAFQKFSKWLKEN